MFELDNSPFTSTVVDCNNLPNPTNGQVNQTTGTTFGQTATYDCDVGYNLEGDSTRMCQATGMWSGSEPNCTSESKLTIATYLVTLLRCQTEISFLNLIFLLSFNSCRLRHPD